MLQYQVEKNYTQSRYWLVLNFFLADRKRTAVIVIF